MVLSNEQIAELELLAKDLTIAQIADYFGISESTFHELKNRDSGVYGAYKKGKATGIKEATRGISNISVKRYGFEEKTTHKTVSFC